MKKSPGTIQRFFAGLAESTFQTQLGVADPPLVDYISKLLLKFLRSDTVYKIRSPRGRQLGDMAELIKEADQRIGAARREVHQHIGDYALFWAGLYPESLKPKRGNASLDRFNDYCQQGRRAYFIASTIDTDDEAADSNDVLKRLADQFEMCAFGLREVRSEWERGDDGEERVLLV